MTIAYCTLPPSGDAYYSDTGNNYKEIGNIQQYNFSFNVTSPVNLTRIYVTLINQTYFSLTDYAYSSYSDLSFGNFSLWEGYWYNQTGEKIFFDDVSEYNFTLTLNLTNSIEKNLTINITMDDDLSNTTSLLYLFVDNKAPRYIYYFNTTYDYYNYSYNLTRTLVIEDTFFDHAAYNFVKENSTLKQIIYAILSNERVKIINYSSFSFILVTPYYSFIPTALYNGTHLLVPAYSYFSADDSPIKAIYAVFNISYAKKDSKGRVTEVFPAYYVGAVTRDFIKEDIDFSSTYLKWSTYDESGNEINTSYVFNLSMLSSPLYLRATHNSNYTLRSFFYDKWNNINNTIEYFEINNTDYPIYLDHLSPEDSIDVIIGKDVYFLADVKDLYAFNSTCSLLIDGNVVKTKSNVSIEQLNFSYVFTNEGTYSYFWKCYNDIGSYNTTDTFSIQALNRSDIALSMKYYDHPSKGIDFEGNITVCNIGSRIEYMFNVTIDICEDASCSSKIANFNYLYESLKEGSCKNATFNISNIDGDYYIKANVVNATFDIISENNELSKFISTKPSLSVISLINAEGNTDLTAIKPGTNLTIRMSIKDFEGNVISGITKENFTIYDRWSEKNTKYIAYSPASVTYNNSGGYYVINYTAPSKTADGYYMYKTHDIIISADKLTNYSTVNTSSYTYELDAPYVQITLSLESNTIQVDSTTTLTVKAKNLGTATVDSTSVVLKIYDAEVAKFDGTKANTTCSSATDINGGDEITVCTVSVKGLSVGDATIKVDLDNTDSYYTASGYGDMKYQENEAVSLTVIQEQTQDTQTNSESSSSSTYSSSSTDSNDNTTQQTTKEASNSLTLELILDKKYELTYNESQEIIIGIKNTGSEILVINKNELSFEHDNLIEINYDFTGATINPGKQYNLKINVLPKDIGEFLFTVKIEKGGKTIKKQAKFIVNPNEEKIKEIKQKFEIVKDNVDELKDEIDENSIYYNEFKAIENMTEEINNLITQGNYLKAYALLRVVQNDLETLKEKIKVSKKGNSSKWWWWVLVLLIIVGIGGGVFYYLWTPEQSGFDPTKGYYYVPPIQQEQRKNYFSKLKNLIEDKLHHKKSIEEAYPDLKKEGS